MSGIVIPHSDGGIMACRAMKRGMPAATFALCNGAFDLLHVGHTRLFRLAKEYASYLIVAVNTDRQIRATKGENRPIVSLADRMELLAQLTLVDVVFPFDEPTPCRLVSEIQPDFLVKGSDYKDRDFPELPIVKEYGGTVVFASWAKDRSTTEFATRSQGSLVLRTKKSGKVLTT